MGRPVYPFLPTWEDRRFRKELAKRPSAEKQAVLEEIGALIDILAECRDPTSDERLRSYRPSTYRAPGLGKRPRLYEYRLSGVIRVIAAWVEEGEVVLIIAATLSHDHPQLRRLIKQHRSALSDCWRRRRRGYLGEPVHVAPPLAADRGLGARRSGGQQGGAERHRRDRSHGRPPPFTCSLRTIALSGCVDIPVDRISPAPPDHPQGEFVLEPLAGDPAVELAEDSPVESRGV